MRILLLLALLAIIMSIGLSACGPKPDGGGEIPIKMEYGSVSLPAFSSTPSIQFNAIQIERGFARA